MTDDPGAIRRRRLARATAAAAGRAAAALGKAGGAPAAPGDLFVLREAAGFGVEWLVIERHPADPERFFAVPADTNPLLGGHDWALSRDATTGPLSLRCAFGLWLPAWRLAPELRVGSVASESLAQAARWCGAIRGAGGHGAREGEAGAGAGATSAAGWDAAGADPEYEDWLDDMIAPARAAVAAMAEIAAPVEPEAGRVRRAKPPGTGRVRRRLYWLPFAASLLLVLALGLGLGGALVRQTRLAHRLGAERDSLRSELRPAAAAAAPAATGAPPASAAGENDDVLPNLPFIVLQPEVLRGQAQKVRLAAAPRRLVLLAVEPRRGSSFQEFRLEIRDLRSGRRVWSGSGLHLDPSSGLVMIGIRQRLLPPGLYDLRLDGLTSGRADRAGTYSLEVETAAAETQPPASP